MKAGVLALQGDVREHCSTLNRIGAQPIEVRTPDELDGVDVLVLPGGESTTLSLLMASNGLDQAVAQRLSAGMPAFGTCAGMILLAADVSDGRPDQRSFGAIDIGVRRNGYGRQLESFEADLRVTVLGDRPLRAVFIRAPRVDRVGEEVEVLAEHEGRAVLCRQGPVLVSAFHPELSGDARLHEFFLKGF